MIGAGESCCGAAPTDIGEAQDSHEQMTSMLPIHRAERLNKTHLEECGAV